MRNVTLIGMPSSGKSTIGVVLAKALGFKFIDGDLLIQEQEGKLLRELIAELGEKRFLELEEEVNASIHVEHAVISPGGSVIYGAKAMEHLREISTIVYIKLPFKTIQKRIGDPQKRGVVLKPNKTLKDLYDERTPIYEKYAHFYVEADGLSIGDLLETILLALRYWEE